MTGRNHAYGPRHTRALAETKRPALFRAPAAERAGDQCQTVWIQSLAK
jgi:hypothetical protein